MSRLKTLSLAVVIVSFSVAPVWSDDAFETALAFAEQGAPSRAVSLFMDLADQGDCAAQANLAVLYARGEGVLQDSETALYWAWRARICGEERAEPLVRYLSHFLSVEEQGFVADRLISNYEELAERGQTSAFMAIGRVWLQVVDPANLQQAQAWFTLATAFEVSEAFELRTTLAAGFDNETLSQITGQAHDLFSLWCDRVPRDDRVETCDMTGSH